MSHIPKLQISNLEAGYGDLQVLWNLSLQVADRNIVSLIGSNGAGKTTVLKTIAGMIRPYSGAIVFGETALNIASVQKIVELGVVYVPEGRGLFQDMTVLENLEMGCYSSRARKNRDSNLEKVHGIFPVLKTRGRQSAGTLSGGEAQMLAIGRGLMSSPRLLMLDEPSAGISPIVAESIFKAIEKLREEGLTMLIVEQDAGRSLKICDYAYVLENGATSLEGSGDELLDNNYVRQAYLGM